MRVHAREISGIILLVVLAGLATDVYAARPRYRYGETWWKEYRSDEDTSLLLHFGRPQVSARQKLAKTVKQKRTEGKLPDLDLDDAPDADWKELQVDKMTPDDFAKPPVDDSNVPPGVVLDYSDARHKLDLGEGAKITPEGRFGEGLALDGTGAVRVPVAVGKTGSFECWFKVDTYPQKSACLFSIAEDETRLLLHPDGRLEFRLAKPHGNPGTNPNQKEGLTEAQREQILLRDAEIITPDPIPTGQWTHVVIYNKPHPTPGGGEPWDARLKVNGFDVDFYLSERYNDYNFFGRRQTELVIGNSAQMDQGFAGVLDEMRVSTKPRVFYERPSRDWCDRDLQRPVRFDRPYFREDATVFHASLDQGLAYDRKPAPDAGIEADLEGQKPDGLLVPGIRGKGWVLDPEIGFPRFDLQGLNAREGAIEFWLRPVNWDDVTGYWHHTPPRHLHLTVARLFGKDKRDGKTKPFVSVSLPRAHNNERSRIPLDPGHWTHVLVRWRKGGKHGSVFLNGKRRARAHRIGPEDRAHIEPLYAQFGIPDKVTVKLDQAPLLEIDEVVGYSVPPRDDEVVQARKRWMQEIEPIPLFQMQISFKYSLQKLEATLKPLLPRAQQPATAALTVAAVAGENKPSFATQTAPLRKGAAHFLVQEGDTLPHGTYLFRFKIKNAAGEVLLEDEREWTYKEEPWRHCRAGILERPMPPWTPVEASPKRVKTRMSTYTLGPDSLPVEIHADGVNLLAGPVRLLEGDKPLSGKLVEMEPAKPVSVDWQAAFTGTTCDIDMHCHAEYDGMVKYTLQLRPKGKVDRLRFVVPIKAVHAKRFLYYPMGARGVKTGVVDDEDGVVLESRAPHAPYKIWRAFTRKREKNPKLTWKAYWEPIKAKMQQYGFFGHVDINDMNRGLWWFCDNAAGWWQSKTQSAIELVRRGDTVALECNLVAAPVDYEPGKPIVFALLPHPARPMVEKYRLFERVSPEKDPLACSIYDAFRPWPASPRYGGASLNMKLFPAVDPENPEAGPSWEYAERCIPNMKSTKPVGYRTLYLSKAWFSCRAGAYDNWEWRSGGSSAVSLTPWFVNYLCWEMNEWIGRGIWNAIYLDECYEHPARNLEAGLSVRLPDGSEQPGVTNFQFRALMKRWRGIFHAHGKQPRARRSTKITGTTCSAGARATRTCRSSRTGTMRSTSRWRTRAARPRSVSTSSRARSSSSRATGAGSRIASRSSSTCRRSGFRLRPRSATGIRGTRPRRARTS